LSTICSSQAPVRTSIRFPNAQNGSGSGGIDYDPLNHTVYVANDSKPYFLTGINLLAKTVSCQLALPAESFYVRFSPADGLIDLALFTLGSSGVLVYDPVANAIRAIYPTPACTAAALDIDPVTNAGLIGGYGGQQARCA
jgi:hypothetical protein